MAVITNPTAGMRNGKLWGFEFEHVIAATAVFVLSNVILNLLDAPLIFSWVLAGTVILTLRIVSIGKKSGFLSFLLAWIVYPHLYLGRVKRRNIEHHV